MHWDAIYGSFYIQSYTEDDNVGGTKLNPADSLIIMAVASAVGVVMMAWHHFIVLAI